ncbi:MAG: reverse transcriptase family protein, partial [Candidatus Thiodiazotropha sp.]
MTAWNVQGLSSKYNNKLEFPDFIHLFNENDIIFFCETWTSTLSNIDVEHFETVSLHREEKKITAKCDSGGLIIYIRKSIFAGIEVVLKENDDIILLKANADFFGFEKDMYFCFSYILPSGSSRQAMMESDTFDRISQNIAKLQNLQNRDFSFVLLGDLNSRTASRPDFITNDTDNRYVPLPDDYLPDLDIGPRVSCDRVTNENGQKLLDLCRGCSLRIWNGRLHDDKDKGSFTCITSRGQSVVDYVISTPEVFKLVTNFKVHDPSIFSDHCQLSFELKIPVALTTENKQFPNCTSKLKWKQEFENDYFAQLSDVTTTDKLDETVRVINEQQANPSLETVNNIVEDFSSVITDVAKQFFLTNIRTKSSSKVTKPQPKWYSEECEQSRKCFHSNLNRYRNEKSDINRENLVGSRKLFKDNVRKCKFEYDKIQTRKLINAKTSNPKEFWKMLGSFTAHKEVNITSEEFANYFKAINNPTDQFYNADVDITDFVANHENRELQAVFDQLDIEISVTEIRESIRELAMDKSAGPDNILNEFITKGENILIPYLHHLFNFIFNSGKFPEAWSEGYIIPIHKKGDTDNPDNYRGITLLSCLGKLFTRILNKRLNNWAESNFLYVEAQAGFRAGMGTVDNIFVLHALLTKFLNSGKKLYCAFIDFSKAFDYIVRENLWYKLIKFGVSGKMYTVIKSMYENAKSMVRHNCSLSEPFACKTGVRQGESLSPFLFSIYLNDLENVLATGGVDGVEVNMLKLFLILYADDIVLLSESPEDLQRSLNMFHIYCDTWKLSLNTTKSKVVVFRKGGRLPLGLNFNYNGKNLEIVQSFTYLGVVFSSTGSFSQLQETLASQAQKALFKLDKCIQPFTGLTPSFICDLFDKLVVPVLCYASEVWGFIRAPAIERVHLKFMKKLLKIKQSTQNDFVYGELGRVSLLVKRQVRIVKYWIKIVASNDCKYIKILYTDMLNEIDRNPRSVNWASLVRNLLESSGFAHVWFFQGVGDTNVFLNIFKTRINDIFIQGWRQRLNDSPRARFYVQLTNVFKPFILPYPLQTATLLRPLFLA